MSALQYMHAKQARNHRWRACLYLPLCEDDMNQNKVYLSRKSNWREKMKVRWLLELFFSIVETLLIGENSACQSLWCKFVALSTDL
jgi:hypothetical protein